MAFIQCDFSSETLGLAVSMNVILPQNTTQQIGMEGAASEGKHPTLYLLHGLSDDHSIWMRRTSIERYVSKLGLAVVMPAVNRSYYANMVSGPQYWTFISEELPKLARSFFPLSDKREDNFVAGLSMGGYGAFKLALSFPERYAAAASLSGALLTDWMFDARPQEAALIFGSKERFAGSENDLAALAEKAASNEVAASPLLYQCCGTEDFLYKENIRFRDHAQSLSLPITYEEEPGTHEWGYWDMKIQRVLEWLPIRT
ncbi:alpha/beta hydrolase [Paenibacillus contaminans]|uniref:Esterase family protein n=1 Tax=Paenibacillus contaminans TaxID=450362 RepID=A0A329MKL2_9BACL|nr:alpha/beta hydrolase family protein [Paenibacillus contaminans]RAV19846.1 esterase family protein [Paenibacillus contaminans]